MADSSVADALHKHAVALRRARARMGWSQRALAERSEIPQPPISRIEAGAVDPKLSMLLERLRALEMDVVLVPRQAPNPVEAIRGPGIPVAQGFYCDTVQARL